MPTLKAVHRERIKKDGTAEIQIRITHNRKIAYVRTGYYVKPGQLKDGIVTKHPDAALLNVKIEQKKSELLQNILKQDLAGEQINIGRAADKRPGSTETMFGAIKHVMKKYEAQNMPASYTLLKTNLDHIQAAWENDIYIVDIKKLDVEKFVNYRYSLGNAKTTIKKNLSHLATVLNHIGYQGHNYFLEYAKSITAKPVKREKLTFEELKALENVSLTGMADIARDMFLFSFYTHGMRFENVVTFKREFIKDGYIDYRMNKGEDVREILIHPKLQAIIDKYIHAQTMYLFPLVNREHNIWNKKDVLGPSNTLVNNFLINAAQRAGIEKRVHFHMARHTFAYLSKKKLVNATIIQDALGHSKASTTAGYLKSLSDDEINEGLRSVYE
jgi:integrase